MPKFVSVATGQKGEQAVVSISETFARGRDLEIVDQPATDDRGRPLPPRALAKKSEPHHTSVKSAAKNNQGGSVALTPEEASK